MSKMKYYKHAETLFLQDNLSVDEICKNLNVFVARFFIGEKSTSGIRKKLQSLRKRRLFQKSCKGL